MSDSRLTFAALKALSGLAVQMPGLSVGALANRSFDLRELRYFHHVARVGNFGRAARDLNLATPALTQQVAKLEQTLGATLLIRHRRGVTLTPAGASLLERLEHIHHLLNVPLREADVPTLTSGTVSVGLPPEMAPLVAPPFLESCQQRWPGVTVLFREGSSATLEEWVLGLQADIAVLQDPPGLQALHLDPVLTERLGLVSGGRVETDPAPVRVRALAGLKLILPGARHWTRRLVEGAAFRRGVVLDRVQEIESVALAKEMVRGGLGQTVLPMIAVRDEVARGVLSFRPIEHDTLVAAHAIATRSLSAPAPFIVDIGLALRATMLGLANAGQWPGASPIRSARRAPQAETDGPEADAPDDAIPANTD